VLAAVGRAPPADSTQAHRGRHVAGGAYRFPRFCDSALPAAVFVAALERPSFNAAEALDAAGVEVVFLGAFVCDSALPAADFDFAPVAPLFRTDDAFDAARLLVSLDIARLR
jgi:hypothetical protein